MDLVWQHLLGTTITDLEFLYWTKYESQTMARRYVPSSSRKRRICPRFRRTRFGAVCLRASWSGCFWHRPSHWAENRLIRFVKIVDGSSFACTIWYVGVYFFFSERRSYMNVPTALRTYGIPNESKKKKFCGSPPNVDQRDSHGNILLHHRPDGKWNAHAHDPHEPYNKQTKQKASPIS